MLFHEVEPFKLFNLDDLPPPLKPLLVASSTADRRFFKL
jgi:hypothetical protein